MTESPAQDSERKKQEKKLKEKGTNFTIPNQLVTILVGPEKKEFLVHKEFACQYSPVLKAAFNSTFVEGQTQNYTLEDVTEPVARLLVNWLYTQQLDICRYESGHSKKRQEDLELCQLWVTADQLLIPKLQNLIVRTMAELRQETDVTATGAIEYVYENTCKESPLRKLLLHQCACYLTHTWFWKNPDQFPKEFLLDLAELTIKVMDRKDTKKHLGIVSKPSQYEVAED